ncbi:sialoadhesin-like [Danio aesculapii]|uniref:sialoadhesin-like n=1 Tax=Danio aesculapii TaxID=1142201 RepID=UPI0024C0A0CB|nr:sialoadhesin-like [Danio aesculapii]
MKASVLLHLLLQGFLMFGALGVQVRMPKTIHGLKGSCLVIPCSFSYKSNPPKNPHRVVWYQWHSIRYPLVYDALQENEVAEKFRGKTDLYTGSRGDCSLVIKNLDQSHHGEKLYTGINSNKFHEVTSTVLVDTRPQLPSISISGGEKMGDKITVTCSASHMCPYSKPNITLNGIEGSDRTNEECSEDGQCRITLTRTGVVKAENTVFECSVTHHGGINTSAAKDKSALCVHQNITIEPEIADVTQGVKQIFTCTVHHSCKKENPTITWNYENMQVSEGTKIVSGFDRVTFSNITFLDTTEDYGKNLTCNAQFSGGNFTASVALYVQCIDHNITIEPAIAHVTEGVAQNFTCTVYHTCQKENPTITWNYENMQVSEGTKTLSGFDRVAYSTITFLGATEDHGKKLICSAEFSEGNITAFVALHVPSVVMIIRLKIIGLYIAAPSLVFIFACILVGVIIWRKRHRPKNEDTVYENNLLSKPHTPSSKRDPKLQSRKNEADLYVNLEDLYENI